MYNDRMIEITATEYEELTRNERIVEALKAVGVEDWNRYEEAMESIKEELED